MSNSTTNQSALPGAPGLETWLTREYGIRHPFIRAGMGFIAHERLAAAVTNAGGLGVLGACPDPADTLPVMVERLRALTSGPFGVARKVAAVKTIRRYLPPQSHRAGPRPGLERRRPGAVHADAVTAR